MHIDPNRMIGSVRAVRIRDICRHARKSPSQSFHVADIALAFKLSPAAATKCLKILLSEGYAAPSPSTGDPYYTPTQAGLRMASASIHVYKRAACERALSGLIERSKAAIGDPRFLYVVTEICVFGSFLGSNETLSDVDVALTNRAKIDDPDDRFAVRRAHVHQYKRPDFTFIQRLNFAENQFHLYLKARSPILSFHERSDLEKAGIPYHIVYRYTPSPAEWDGLAAMTCRRWGVDPANPPPADRYF